MGRGSESPPLADREREHHYAPWSRPHRWRRRKAGATLAHLFNQVEQEDAFTVLDIMKKRNGDEN